MTTNILSNNLVKENDFKYIFVKNGPDYQVDETKNIQYQINILWNNEVIHTSHIDSNQSFSVGETIDCNYYMPKEKINVDKLLIISDNKVNTPNKNIDLLVGSKHEFMLSDFTFQVMANYKVKSVKDKYSFDKLVGAFIGLSFVSHFALLFSTSLFIPSVEGFENEVSIEQQLLMSQQLASIAEKEEKKTESIAESVNQQSQGGTGTRAKGSEGLMGNHNATSKGRYAVSGPKDNVDPHIAKQKMLEEVSNFGLIGLLASSSGGDPNAPTAVWGRDDSLGNDPVSANGSLWGNSIGESFGNNGLSLTGLGESGGGDGEGIGLGRINTIGHGDGTGTNQGFGPGPGKINGNHKISTPKLRVGTTNTSGKIPPETIQRIVRQNFGRFRSCYENGLRNNPNLNGRVTVRFVIDRNGVASQSSNGGSDLPDSSVVRCVTSSFNGLSFPPPESGIVTVGYSIQFSPN